MDNRVVSNAQHLQELILCIAQRNQSLRTEIQGIFQPFGLNFEQIPYLCRLLKQYELTSNEIVGQTQLYLQRKPSWLEQCSDVQQEQNAQIASLSLRTQDYAQQTSLISERMQLVEIDLQQFINEQGITVEQVQRRDISLSQLQLISKQFQDLMQKNDVVWDDWQAVKQKRLEFSKEIESLKRNLPQLENIAQEFLPSEELLKEQQNALKRLQRFVRLDIVIPLSIVLICWEKLSFQVNSFEKWKSTLFPEECIAELSVFRQRLQSQNRSKVLIRLLLFHCVIELFWAFYIRIRIENLWLPKSKKIDD